MPRAPPSFAPPLLQLPLPRALPPALLPLSPRACAFVAPFAIRACHARRARPRGRTIFATASSGEEELFIRRHAAERAAKPDESRAGADADEAHFDFDKDKVATPAAPIVPETGVDDAPVGAPVPAEAAEGDGGARSAEVAGAAPGAPAEGADSRAKAMRPVRVFSFARFRKVGSRVGKETSRLVTESRVTSHVRMPTRRETVLLAWEVALVLALLTLLRAGVASTLRWIHNRLNATRGLKSNIPYEASVFECMQRPLEFLSLFTVGTALAEVVSRPLAATGLLRHIRTLRELGFIISATWFLLRWIDRIRSRFAVDKRIDKAQVDATSRIVTVATTLISLLISLDTIGINIQTVLAFGGIGGVAIGFAGREIISNFFGGFMIYVTRPFTVGEWIRSIEEQELNGTVEDIGWYLTRVRTWNKRPLYIPNSRFSTLIVENGSRMDNRRILHTLRLRLEDMPVVPTIVTAIESLLMNHPELDPRQHRLAYVDSFGEFSVNIWMSCYTKSVFLYDFRRVQQDVLLKCHEIIRANGAKLATINTRDVRPGIDTDRYGPPGNAASFGKAAANTQTVDNAPTFVPVNSDVPGARLHRTPNPLDSYLSIESGVRPPQTGQPAPVAGAPTNGVVGKTDDAVVVPSGSEEPMQRSTSAAAVAAAAAALTAARRNAARIEDNAKVDKKEPVVNKADAVESKPSASEVKAPASPKPAQMKISAAPPIRSSSSAPAGVAPTGPAATAPASTSEGKSSDDGTAPVASKQAPSPPQPVQPAPSPPQPRQAQGEDIPVASKSATGTPNAAAPGVMQIGKARKPISVAPVSAETEGKSAGSASQPPPPQSNSGTASQGATDETNSET